MKEHEIRPQALVDRYRELCAEDAATCFGDEPARRLACVACDGTQLSHEFEKDGFAYAQCTTCDTLFQTPRPPRAAFERFYRHSESSRYWAEVFFPAVAEIRRLKIFQDRVERLAGMCAEKNAKVDRIVDVGAGYGIFLEEWRRRLPDLSLWQSNPPPPSLGACRAKGFEVVEDIVENVTGREDSADLVDML